MSVYPQTRFGGAWLLLACVACQGPEEAPAVQQEGMGSSPAVQPTVAASEAIPDSWGLGSHDVASFIEEWDHDIGPDGADLPPGSGTAEQGEPLYQALCASCHGVEGEGMAINPRLVTTGTAEEQFRARGIGQFWPYTSTLYDYVRRSMPQTAPGSLEPDEIYALVAWMLEKNGRIGPSDEMNPETLMAVEMPGRDKFVPDDRVPGPTIR